MNKRDLALKVAEKHLNLPYKWGGDDPLSGFDCSGFIIEILKSVGIVGPNFDDTANGLSQKFPDTEILQPGVLVFWDWNNDGLVDHVEMIAHIDEEGNAYTIGASGGNSGTSTPQRATSDNAYVKIRPLQSGYTIANDPF